MLEILKKRIEEVSGKNCIAGFAADFPYITLTGNNIIIQPESQESRTIGLNHRTEINRRVKLIYGRFNNKKTGSLEEVEWVEEFLKLEYSSIYKMLGMKVEGHISNFYYDKLSTKLEKFIYGKMKI